VFVGEIEKLLNHVLRLDEANLDLLGQLSGKVIAVEIENINQTIFLLFTQQGITLKAKYDEHVDVTLKGSPVVLLGILLSRESNTENISGDMEIIGDVGLAQRFQSVIKNLEIDWEEYLSHWVGDTAAHKLGNLFRDARRFANETRDTIGLDISEYLRYEKDMLPDKSEIDEFNSVVDVIRNDAGRLKQRIERLERKLTEKV
jgi:ubiquinone biosynthesis protein UbiJ